MLVAIILIILSVVVGVCLVGLVYANDFSLPEIDFRKYKQPAKPLTIVAIYPHPDDETMAVGGTLAKYAAMPDTRVVVITATHGEQGETNGVCEFSELAAARELELKNAIAAMGVDELILWEFPDSGLDKVQADLKQRLVAELPKLQPDVILSYDGSGLYGHPDHIVLSLIVQETAKALLPATKVFFNTLPRRTLKQIKLPDKITLQDRVIELDRGALEHTLPEYRSSFLRYGGSKIAAIKAHRSQNIAKHLPVPLWFFRLIGWVEYFSEDSA